MKNISTCLLLFIGSLMLSCSQPSATDYTQFVDPFIGTEGFGHTFPGATTPMGMVQVSPQTGNYAWKYCSGYQYTDTLVRGYAHTQLNGTGVGDLGDVILLPFKEGKVDNVFKVPFSKEKEVASPNYYSTELTKDHIKVELTSAEHVGMHRYSFEQAGDYKLLLNINNTMTGAGNKNTTQVVDAKINIENNRTLTGFMHVNRWIDRKLFFVIELSKPFTNTSFVEGYKDRIMLMDFPMADAEELEVKVGISTVNIKGAKKNLLAEAKNKTFDQLHQQGKDKWNEYLSRVEIEGTKEQKVTFYTSLYHLFIQPNNIADVDGQYRGAKGKVATAPSKKYYSTFSLWDTYRAAHPLYTILSPEKDTEFVESMLTHGEENGYLPIWTLMGKENHCMIGNHSVAAIVDAYHKGLLEGNERRAYQLIKQSLTTNHWHKYDWQIYDKYGFLPSDIFKKEAVSRTLEATFDDWCAATMAKDLGEMDDYVFFSKRSEYYKNIFDESTGFFRGKNSDSSWVTPFDPLRNSHGPTTGGDYTEGNAWHYSWHILQDPESLVELMGGKLEMAEKLDALFTMDAPVDEHAADVTGLIGQYAHGNEPSHHVIYLYNYVDQPQKAQQLIRQVMATQYLNSPDGLSGNDDCGQMSAWYVFSALGFYPVNPASGEFNIGLPLYEKTSLKLGENTLTIKANNLSEKNCYVKSVTYNGEPITDWKIAYSQIMNGGVLEFEMEGENSLMALF
ncbi:GH92 family glycosyl hydrolase [Persicobacter psychrovividus]|uniref:Alpha-1 2-mannosidase n=1 Tax=Persicobacter psychrovividus TaxID=387638 RepID=A0ABM7VM07_9BACT|nr:alpha-1 2-mannosidase [Persicobacter psychrovividus]